MKEENFLQLTHLVQTKTAKKNKQRPQNEQLAKQIDEVLAYLNEKADKRFSLKSQANRSFISGRLHEGFSVADCKLVIDEQVSCWLGHQELEKYLRPMTLFRPANFESYLNNALSKQRPKTVPKPVVLDFSAGENL